MFYSLGLPNFELDTEEGQASPAPLRNTSYTEEDVSTSMSSVSLLEYTTLHEVGGFLVVSPTPSMRTPGLR